MPRENDLLVGLFYASETGHTKERAFDIEKQLRKTPFCLTSSPRDIADIVADDFLSYDFLIIGCPTWNIGELQVDLGEVFRDFDTQDWSGKVVAVYGLGDQEGYPDTYQDAIGILVRKLISRGATLVGRTALDGHHFEGSLAVEQGQFLGLALDDDNQSQLTEHRIDTWVKQLVLEFSNVVEERKKNKKLVKTVRK